MIGETRQERIARREKIYTKKKAEEFETLKTALLNGNVSILDETPLVRIKELKEVLSEELSADVMIMIDRVINREETLIKEKRLETKRNSKDNKYPLRETYVRYGAQGAFALMGLGL